MAWSYSGNPADSDLDQVRFLIQDTDSSDQLLQNEEITYLVTSEGGTLKAAAKAAETIAAKFSRKCDEKVGQVSKSYSQKSEQYRKLAAELRRHSSIKQAMPFAGALEVTQKEVQEQDTKRVQPSFTSDLHDFEHPRDSDDRECY